MKTTDAKMFTGHLQSIKALRIVQILETIFFTLSNMQGLLEWCIQNMTLECYLKEIRNYNSEITPIVSVYS